jgi:signal transduction histidine kinase
MAAVSSAHAMIGRTVDRVGSLLRRIIAAPDWPIAAAALLALLAIAEVTGRPDLAPADKTTALLLSLGTTAPLAFLRTYPLPATVAVTLATVLTLVGGDQPTIAGGVAQLACLYVLVRRYSKRVGHAAIERDVTRQIVADTLLENAARGERARIARELHDVVAHHISMISVQAETARLTTPGMPQAGADRLVAIGDTARQALAEMRRLLGVLREDAGAEVDRRPQPGLAQLIELIDEMRDASGTSTRLIVHGHITRLDPGVELTAYRIVQEALSNARRHASNVAVDVELEYTDELLRVHIRDNGPGPAGAPSTAGHGLLGMRERAAMAGGTLRTGEAAVGGFLVEASLPLKEIAR